MLNTVDLQSLNLLKILKSCETNTDFEHLAISADFVNCNLILSLFCTLPNRSERKNWRITSICCSIQAAGATVVIIKPSLRNVCSDSFASGHLALLLLARCAVA